ASVAVREPGRIPCSAWTMTYDGIRRFSSGERMTEDEVAMVRVLVDTLARRLGLVDVYRNETRRAIEKENKQQDAAQVRPARGSRAPVGQVVAPWAAPAVAPRLVPTR